MNNEDPINREHLKHNFWERKKLKSMSGKEWEALCDGCGKCCLNKIEDEETGQVFLTKVACRLYNDSTCRCGQYDNRHQLVPECIVLTPETISKHAYWLPKTCAYLLLWQNKSLFDWHPLISGNFDTVHKAGISIQGQSIPEFEVNDNDWEDHVIEEYD